MRDPEVEDLDEVLTITSALDHEVVRFQVPVHDPVGVRLGQPGERLLEDLGDALGREWVLAGEQIGVGAPWDKLHREEERGVVLLPEVDDLDDVRVAQPRRALGLADEILRGDWVARVLGGHHLDGELTIEVGLVPLVHVAHPPLADAANDLDRPV